MIIADKSAATLLRNGIIDPKFNETLREIDKENNHYIHLFGYPTEPSLQHKHVILHLVGAWTYQQDGPKYTNTLTTDSGTNAYWTSPIEHKYSHKCLYPFSEKTLEQLGINYQLNVKAYGEGYPYCDGNLIHIPGFVYAPYTSGSTRNLIDEKKKEFLEAIPKLIKTLCSKTYQNKIRSSTAQTTLNKEDVGKLLLGRAISREQAMRKRLTQKYRELVKLQKEYRSIRAQIFNIDDKEIEKINKLIPKMYTSIQVTEDSIVAVTTPIHVRRNNLGSLVVRYSYTDEYVEIKSLNRNYSYAHPHTDPTGVACLGNISSAIPALFRQGHISTALGLIHHYLKTYTRNDAYWRFSRNSTPPQYSVNNDLCITRRQKTTTPSSILQCSECGVYEIELNVNACPHCKSLVCYDCIDGHYNACRYHDNYANNHLCYTCPNCSARLCVHDTVCPSCDE